MRKIHYILFAIALIFCTCSKEESGTDPDARVKIAVGLEMPSPTKGPYGLSVPTAANPLDAEVWASTTPYVFKDEGKNGSDPDKSVSIHSDAHFQSGDPQLLSQIIYSKDGTVIYFTGLYPQDVFSVSDDGATASAIFDGSKDIMFASQVSGSYGAKDNSGNYIWPKLHFYHMLTYISIEIVAESETIARAWGEIKDMRLKSSIEDGKLYNAVSIPLNTSVTYSGNRYSAQDVRYYNECDDLLFYSNGTVNDVFPGAGGYELDYSPEEVAYTLCAPVTGTGNGSNEFNIEITTGRRSLIVPVNLMEGENTEYIGSTMGKRFDIQLFFRAGDNIMVSALCNEWKTGGTGSAELDELN